MSLPIGTTEKITADRLFASGYDTVDIAKFYGITEAEALARVTVERCRRLCLIDPYMPRPSRKPKGWHRKRIAYAGREY